MKVLIASVLAATLLTGCGGVNKYFKGSLLVIEANQSDEYKSEAVQACRVKARSTTELRECLVLDRKVR